MDLGNYKIKVTTEAESKEAQELFFALGFEWNTGLGVLFTKEFQGRNCLCYFDKNEEVMLDGWAGQELTLPQLRDLVVLHRNDVSDANYIGKYCGDFYVTSDGITYGWNDIDAWKKDSHNTMDHIQPINRELISGADALRALADGKEVEFFYRDVWDSIGEMIVIDHFMSDKFKFRLKPRTITLNIEIPAPFKPKEHEDCYMLTDLYEHGYTRTSWKYSKSVPAWRTEAEIKQVVSALRGALKNG